MVLKLTALALASIVFCHAAAAQQAAPAPAAPPPTAPDAIPEKLAPSDAPATDLSQKKGNLSDKLNESNGVIRPEGAIDPKMQKQAPATGSTPIIAPPTAPNAQPK
jgi:hypothetical protein